jgi:hypothetical protein
MINLLEERKLVHIDKPPVPMDTKWRPYGWDSSIEIEGFVIDIKDLFFKFRFIRLEDFQDDWFTWMYWREYKKLEIISAEYYNDSKWWWVIPLVNNKLNPIFEFPLNPEEIEDLSKVMLSEKKDGGTFACKEYITEKVGNRIINSLYENFGVKSFTAHYSEEEYEQLKLNYPANIDFIVRYIYIENDYFFDMADVNDHKNEIPLILYEDILIRAQQYDGILTMREFDRRYEELLKEYYDIFFGVLDQFIIDRNELKRRIIVVKSMYLGRFITDLRKKIAEPNTTKGFFNYMKGE